MDRILSTKFWLNFLVPLNAFSGNLEYSHEISDNEQTVAIATGYSMPLAHSSSVVTVITANEIKKMGTITIEKVLETVPGLHISSANGE